MAKVDRFEDLRCWQQARLLVSEIYQLTSEDPVRSDFGLKDQIRRAALSVMNNTAEGFARFSKKEFILFLNYAQSSAAEVKSILYVCEDLHYLPAEKAQHLHQQLDLTRKSILALIKYLSSGEKKFSSMSGSRVREPRENYRLKQEAYQLPEQYVYVDSDNV